MKTILILVDGMRSDALEQTANAQEVLQNSAYTMTAQTVMPSVTLPCHMSLFHSVDPTRHGTTTNTYMPQVRPIRGLCEVLHGAGKRCAFFYNWEELRDLSRPDTLDFSYFCKGRDIGYGKANNIITDAAISYLSENKTDFAFLYYGFTDAAGHNHGWMTEPYMDAMKNSWDNINKIVTALPEDYMIIVTADHGGHDRTHGTDLPEDMTIPIVAFQKGQKPDWDFTDATIKDIAPTITALLGVSADAEWEGKCLLK